MAEDEETEAEQSLRSKT